jgi:hypothetical protein
VIENRRRSSALKKGTTIAPITANIVPDAKAALIISIEVQVRSPNESSITLLPGFSRNQQQDGRVGARPEASFQVFQPELIGTFGVSLKAGIGKANSAAVEITVSTRGPPLYNLDHMHHFSFDAIHP